MANPVMNAFDESIALEGKPMTINGTVNKSFLLFGILLLTACYSWGLIAAGLTDKASMLMGAGSIIGFILALIICFTRKALHILTPIYAACEGLLLGGVSAVYNGEYSGIVFQAIIVTIITLASMLIMYKSKMIQATPTFKKVIFTATLSVALIYLIQFIASFFGRGIPQIFTNSNIGILFSVIVSLIAAFNLIVDFDFIEKGEANLLPEKYEWYGAFGLMVTLVWLYLEILRLLAKSRSRN